MIKSYKYNWLILIQLFLIVAYCTPIFSKYLHGIVFFVPLLTIFFIFYASTKSFKSTFLLVNKSLRKNRVLFVMLLWYIIGLAFSFLRYAENTNFLLSAILLPAFFFYGLFINNRPKYHYITIILLVFFIFLNTFIAGKEIGENLSARDILTKAHSLADPVGAAGFWGIIGIFFPIFLINLKKIHNKVLYTIYTAVLIYLLYKLIFAGFATALGLLALNLVTISILFLFYRTKNWRLFLGSLLLLTFAIGSIYFLGNWIITSKLKGLSAIQWRILNVIKDPSNGGYTSNYTSRIDLFLVSLKTFKQFPFFGSGADIMTMSHIFPELKCGGHSSFIDVLAILGLFGGGSALIYFFFKSFSNAVSLMNKSRSFEDICHTSVVFTLIVGGILNPYWMGTILIIFLLITRIYKTRSSSIER